MGTGHVMRCLALAEPWFAAGSKVTLAAQLMPDALGQRALKTGVIPHSINAEGGSLEDALETLALAAQHPNAWVVVDGYQFTETYFTLLKQAGVKVLQVDDFGGLKHYETDFVLNQNLGVTAEWYPQREKNARLLLGTRYVQLRGEFLQQSKVKHPDTGKTVRILVTLGGSDPDNVTAKVIAALQIIPAIEATVVIGGSNPHWDSLQASIKNSPSSIRLIRNASNMPELMAHADLAIAAGGTTAWELAYMGVPMMTIVLADNQRSNGEQLEAAGVSINLGWHESIASEALKTQIEMLTKDPRKISEMGAKARRLVDGLGSFRVWLRLNQSSLTLRPATPDDAKLIFDWANDAGVRAVSFSSEPILWENHLAWFNAKLSDPHYRIWVATDVEGTPLGQVRFQLEGSAATISISLDAAYRGKNRGSLLIWTASRQLFHELPALTKIHAYIKPDNGASIRAFEKAEFVKQSETTVKGATAWVYVLGRESIVD
jgi:UDP-2,4-diacetamido-2,4,6-trideoxy-beta-L-altropyranose hydrolase